MGLGLIWCSMSRISFLGMSIQKTNHLLVFYGFWILEGSFECKTKARTMFNTFHQVYILRSKVESRKPIKRSCAKMQQIFLCKLGLVSSRYEDLRNLCSHSYPAEVGDLVKHTFRVNSLRWLSLLICGELCNLFKWN